MGKVLEFSFEDWEPDLDGLGEEELRAWLERVEEGLARLDEKEPKNMNSEAYEEWGDRREVLEDLMDEILDRLDELEG